MTNSAHQGRRVEHAVRDHLTGHGYEVIRAAASKGPADLVAIKHGQVLIVNVKRTALPSPAERVELCRIAALLPGVGVPVVARKPPRRPVRLERLLTPDRAASARVPFLADAAGPMTIPAEGETR